MNPQGDKPTAIILTIFAGSRLEGEGEKEFFQNFLILVTILHKHL